MGPIWDPKSLFLMFFHNFFKIKKSPLTLDIKGLAVIFLFFIILQFSSKMPQTGLEPVHGKPYNDLNVARLPIPPLGHRY